MAGWAGTKLANTTQWTAFRAVILARDQRQCQLRLPGCIGIATHVDHRIPVRDWPEGMFDPTNCQAACAPCNRRKGATPDHYLPRPASPSRDW